jgi:hypothetical protein
LSPALDRAGTAPRGADEEPDEILGVSLSAEAERMIEEGRAERARPMPAAAAPLAGSAAARARAR